MGSPRDWVRQNWAKLRARIIALFGAIALITYIYSGLTTYRALQRDLPNTRASELLSLGREVLPDLEQALAEGSDPASLLQTGSIMEHHGAEIRLYDAGKQVVYETAAIDLNQEAVDAALQGQERAIIATDPETQERFVTVLLPVRQGNQVVGALELAASLREIDRLSNMLQPRLLVGLGFSLLAIGGAGVYLASNVTRTLREIEQAARHISHGDFEYRIERGSDDEVGRLISTVNDMAAELQNLSETRGKFLSNVSHELRTPLTIIKGFALTLDQEIADSSQRRSLHIIDEQTDHMTHLVEDLLAISRLQTGDLKLERRKVDLGQLGKRVMETLAARASHEGIHLSYQANGKDLVAEVDEQRLRQVLYNLLDNALKHTYADGHVSLTIERQGDLIGLSVEDDGVGIPLDKLDHVFDRFFQVEPGKKGAGLGLAVVKEVVEIHNGTVRAESWPGKGATFSIELPAISVDPHG